MFDLTPEKLLILAVLALIVLGPERLPGAARSFGKAIGQLRNLSESARQEMDGVLDEPRKAFNDAMHEVGVPASSVAAAVRSPRTALAASVLGNGKSSEDTSGGGRTTREDTSGAGSPVAPGESQDQHQPEGEGNQARAEVADRGQVWSTPNGVDLIENAPYPDDPDFN